MANLLNNNMGMMVYRDIMGQRVIQRLPMHQDVEKVELKVKVKVVKKQVKEEKKVKEKKQVKEEKKEAGTCKAILSSGPNAGYACSNKITKGNKKYCGMHSEK